MPAAAEASPTSDAQFQEWYAAYPKKADPKDARRVFDRVLKKREATFEQLLEGAKRYAFETRSTDKKYIKAPAVWLNKGSWANEAGAAAPPRAPVSRADSAIEGMFEAMQRREDYRGN